MMELNQEPHAEKTVIQALGLGTAYRYSQSKVPAEISGCKWKQVSMHPVSEVCDLGKMVFCP